MANAKSVEEKITPVEEDDLHCQALVWNHILSVVDSMVLKCAIKLRLFDAIHHHVGDLPISLPYLATALPMSHNSLTILHRLMRYLAHMRLVNVHQGESYTITKAASTYLREGSEKSHASYIRLFVEEDMFAPLHALDTCLGGEATATKIARGESFFGSVARDPALNKRFNDAMMCTVMPTIEAALKGSPEVFEGVNVLVDVGGGTGAAAAAIARAFSSIKCVVYDLAHVVEDAQKLEGVDYKVGDMTVSVPHADAFLLTRVLHTCSDEKALQILNQCRDAIVEEGKVIIIDCVVDEADTQELNHVKLAYDIMMMTYLDGKERTEKEWRILLLKAGFTRCNIKSVMALHHVIEARP